MQFIKQTWQRIVQLWHAYVVPHAVTRWLVRFRGEIMVTVGAGLVAYNILNFSFTTYAGFRPITGGVAYYYPVNVLGWLAIGVMLMVTGLFMINYRPVRRIVPPPPPDSMIE